MALQNLVVGLAQPFSGAVADRFGTARVMIVGSLLYAAGLWMMAHSATGTEFTLSAGLMVGVALSCTNFSIVFGVVGRAFPPHRRAAALGIASAAGSFGQFVMLPYGQALINRIGWHEAFVIMAVTVLVIIPLSSAMVEDTKSRTLSGEKLSVGASLGEALGHRGYLLLCSGYFVCGFQLLFVSIHFPAFLVDQKMTPEVGMAALALIGLFNIFGSYLWGLAGGRYTKKYLLSLLYFLRALLIAVFISLPITPWTVYVFSAVIGFLWLGTVPLTSALIAQIFGVRYLSMLSGIAFLFHQVGSFAGIYAGGWIFDRTGSYTIMWILTIGMGIFAALINLPIDDKPMARLSEQPKPATA
jgi:MFS family permease